jgi:hypothetical protein
MGLWRAGHRTGCNKKTIESDISKASEIRGLNTEDFVVDVFNGFDLKPFLKNDT